MLPRMLPRRTCAGARQAASCHALVVGDGQGGELVAQQLARGAAGHLLGREELDVARPFVAGEPLPAAGDDICRLSASPRASTTTALIVSPQ
jgi:hypothetical protein